MKRLAMAGLLMVVGLVSPTGGPAAGRMPVVRTDDEVVTFVGEVPAGGLFTDVRGVLYMRCAPALGEPELDQALGGRVLCVRMADGPGQAELVAADRWAWPVLASRLTVREQPPPRPWNAEEAADRTAAAKGTRP